MNGLLPNSHSGEKKTKSQEELRMESTRHSPSGSVQSAPIHQNHLPPIKFDGKIDLRRIFSLIEYKGLRFLILDCPTESTLPIIVNEFKKYNVTDVVRVCEPTYNTKKLTEEGISVLDVPYLDGGTPPQHIILKFLGLVQQRYNDFPSKKSMLTASSSQILEPISPMKQEELLSVSMPTVAVENPTIAVHCVAGLGRAPVLIAIALIEHGMANLDAVDFIREKRRGAFNNLQIVYIDRYFTII
eukprot:NODE_4_length_55019_cov_0.425091.p26 type:complete len:243 gc:universal NODE_4_length_55019_cov_0.425091:30734-31462(+)